MYRLSDSIRLRTIEGDGSHWAFNIQDGSHYELNETAYMVLRGIEARRTGREITAGLVAEYGIPARRAESDVSEALEIFECDGLVIKEETHDTTKVQEKAVRKAKGHKAGEDDLHGPWSSKSG